MDFKKVLDQTVREIKREVNKKVLKVPEIEQKVLDATSNEPWGPHGALMAEIAQATRNFNECQMIMNVLWKRVSDTGRNWRHVYKALTVLEYLVANGSERVIDDLREHTYQLSTLSDFQFVEPSGKDQGINVRKKVQNIVALINDKERIQEVRQKAAANRDKYRGVSSTGGMHKPSSYSSTAGGYNGDYYDDDRYGSRYGGREDDRYGQGRDKYGDRYKDEERYGNDGDWQSRDGERYGKDGGDRYSRNGDRYRDDDFGGGRDHEDDRYSSKRGNGYDSDDHYCSRTGPRRGDEFAPNERRYSQKQSEEKSGAPPSYEESIIDSGHNYSDERAGGNLAATVAKASARLSSSNQSQGGTTATQNVPTSSTKADDDFDDFDPRGSSTASVPTPVAADDDFFIQTSAAGLSDAMKAVPPPIASASTSFSASVSSQSSGTDLFADASFGSTLMAPPLSSANSQNQLTGDHFGQSSFKASFPSSEDLFAPQTSSVVSLTSSLTGGIGENSGTFGAVPSKSNTAVGFGNADPFEVNSFSAFRTTLPPVQASEPHSMFQMQTQVLVPEVTQASATTQQQTLFEATRGQILNTTVPAKPQQQKHKFEPKSAIWADTLSRGLIDLNISAPKSNSLSDIGIDLDSITRSERRREEKEKISTLSRGKAMGTGSGLGRAGASTLAPPSAHMMGSMGLGMGMGGYGMGAAASMGMTMGPGMGMAQGMGTSGMGMRPPMGMPSGPGIGVGMNYEMGMGQGGFSNQQQQYGGFR